jgi:AraC-like DNA-binding protein
MDILSLRTNLHLPPEPQIPFYVYTAGTERQAPITRSKGFSANQLLLTFSGGGLFRTLGQDNWDIVDAQTMLYIPANVPHEYVPRSEEPWHVGYVTFADNGSGLLEKWGFGDAMYVKPVRELSRLHELLLAIWACTGPEYDAWRSTELLFAFCLEAKRQSSDAGTPGRLELPLKSSRIRDSITDSAIRFLHDYLQRDLTMTELAARIGYSAKHLNRLFRRDIGMTPMQYLQRIRLRTAALLLTDHPDMTVREVAAYIGMEPDYFGRLFRRVHGLTPVQYRVKNGPP